MSLFKVGDRVSVLHETIKGRVISVSTHLIKVEDEDGFLRAYAPKDLAISTQVDYKIPDDVYSKDEIESTKRILSANKSLGTSQIERTEIDLHIEELRERHMHLTNFEIVQIQMTTCRAFVQGAIASRQKKIVLIHGKGEGVLKSEIRSYLERLSNDKGVQLDYHDASFALYGIGGATEVIFF